MISKKTFLVLVTAALLPVLFQCTKSKGKLQYIENIELCDTSGIISYSAHIVPIISESCGPTNGGCHGYGTYAGYLGTYSGIMMHVPNGMLMHCITQDQPTAYVPMPLGESKLPDCKIAKIRKWIAQGAPDN